MKKKYCRPQIEIHKFVVNPLLVESLPGYSDDLLIGPEEGE